jgi:3-oxoacyl-[acyl-carrier-protein] synthase-1
MTAPVCIAAIGARTPLGMTAAASAAAYRAAVSTFMEHAYLVDITGVPMVGAMDSEMSPYVSGAARLQALAETALVDACTVLEGVADSGTQLPLYFCLPEERPGIAPGETAQVRESLSRVHGSRWRWSDVKAVAAGHAGGFGLMGEALYAIRSGEIEACVVGGVDSYFVPDTMEWLDLTRRLASSRTRSSFVPGEAACFCLLASEQQCRRWGLPVLGTLLSVGAAQEQARMRIGEICVGTGLTAAVGEALRRVDGPMRRVDTIVCDINGERHRGDEWGYACLRLAEWFDDPTTYWSPADCWGDVGAASGPLFVMLACQAAERGYAPGSRFLLWCSSESGLRTAAVLDTARGFGSEGP